MKARNAALVVPVVITLLVGAAVGGLIVVQNQQQSKQIAAAEDIGRDYLTAAEKFRSGVATSIKAADSTKLDEIERALEKAIAKPPKLRPTSSYGRQNSATYREAIDVQSTLLGPYEKLGKQLKKAKVAETFIAAANKVLEMRATDFVGFSVITNSDTVRTKLIPAFINARDTFDAVRVPKGQEELATTVHDAVQYVINQATTLANRIDANTNFSFSYADEFQAAADDLNDYATTVEGDVTEAVNIVIEAG